MTRMESIRRQYEGTAAPPPPSGNGRPSPTRPRNCFWRWFWFLFLVTLLIGFFAGKGTLGQWFAHLHGAGHENTFVGKLLGTDKLAQAQIPEGAAETPASASAAGAAVKLDEATIKAYINPSMAEMNQLCEYVRNSPNVRENAAYNQIMNAVQFFYPAENNVVNAFAAVRKLDEKDKSATRVIVFLGGAARFARVASLAVGLELSGQKGTGRRFVATLKGDDLAKFDDAAAVRLIREANLAAAFGNEQVMAKAKSVSAGLMLGIIAHEAGHQTLNHTLNTSGTVNLEISRNQEREADSFSSSVIASSPFGEYILVGTLFWHYALAMQQGDSAVATTHPLSQERFENFVRANAELAASMGISLPTAGASAAGTGKCQLSE